MKLIYICLFLLLSLLPLQAGEPQKIQLPEHPSRIMTYSGKELQKYIWQRCRLLLPVEERKADKQEKSIICLQVDSISLGKEEYSIHRQQENLYIRGGSAVAVLYGVYAYAEHLGVRFALHGDILPDEKFNGSLYDCPEIKGKPLFEKRGLLPFHDFPEGPDLWDADMYKSCITQMTKMKLNFFSLHTYPHVEPNVWIGLAEDVLPNGNVSYSYPTSLANTARSTSWGYSAMDTRDYSSGAASLFADSAFMSPVLNGVPWPKDSVQMNTVFNRTGNLFNEVFSMGQNLGIQFCVGLESPISIPGRVRERLKQKGINPDSKEAVYELYKGVFTRIKKAHPLDYFWLWSPEGWTWGTPSKASVEATIADVNIARQALTEVLPSCGFGVSGWVLGPPDNKCLFDSVLPENDFVASLSRLCGQERLDLGYHQLPDSRFSFPILWMEDDPALTTPQFWVGRLRSDLAEAYGAGCKGVNANFWRTSSIAPNLMAYAQGCWEQKEWNPFWGKEFKVQLAKSDIRKGGVGRNYYKHIKGTEDQYLYNTQRYDIKGYKINLPNGKYRVSFLFSETKYNEPDKRVFDIALEGKKLLQGIDVYQLAGSDTVCRVVSPDFRVDDFTLDIDILPVKGETFLSAFIIEGMTDDVNQIKGKPYKRCIDVGGGLYKDFEADLNEFESNAPEMNRDLSCKSFYLDYAQAMFGKDVAKDIARIFESVDGTDGNEGFRNFRMPRPAAWITGPGVINPNEKSWQEESVRYAFVDSLENLRDNISGHGNLERFDYWLNTFKYLRAVGQLGCIRGELDKRMKDLSACPPSEQKAFIADRILPIRIQLARTWEEMMGYLILTVNTTGELGTVINLESQTRKTYAFLNKYDSSLESISGQKLPSSVNLSKTYAGTPRLFVLNERNTLEKEEAYTLKLHVSGAEKMEKEPVLYYRELGKKKFKKMKMERKSDGYFEVQAPNRENRTLEYYIEAKFSTQTVRYPASAPQCNHTWVYY